ncbi:MAG: hypothetical protein AB7I33_01005 [Gemmatimonadales bacterium]
MRVTPFSLAFQEIAATRFPQIRDSLASRSADARDRDAFLLDPAVVQLLREIVPDEGVGEAIDQHVALLHTAFLFWLDGERTVRLGRDSAHRLLTAAVPEDDAAGGVDATHYIQFPERLVWAELTEGAPHEPLDGLFAARPAPRDLRVLGVFGVHVDRVGFSIVEVLGAPPVGLQRENGTRLFAPVLPGGEVAKLFSLTGTEEVLELGTRALGLASAVGEAARTGNIIELP